jgi:uncharacterized damage-inducible protein DinB
VTSNSPPDVGVSDMFTKDGIRALHGWTHERLNMVLEHVGTLTADEFARELPGFGYPSIREQLMHTLGAEERWVLRLQDLPIRQWSAAEFPTAAPLRGAKERVMRATEAYLDHLPDSALNVPLAERPKQWIGELRSPAFILYHAMTHAFHHKGQIVAMCRLLGHPAPDTDLQQG